MNSEGAQQSWRVKISLWHLLLLTAIIALVTANVIAKRENESLAQTRATLRSLSSRLAIENIDQVEVVNTPTLASGFKTWHVHIPDGPELELRFGAGEFAGQEMPSVSQSYPLKPGRHRVTIQTLDRRGDEYRYFVYVDGQQVIEQVMGRDWMPFGRSLASGLGWPKGVGKRANSVSLFGQSYVPKHESITLFSGGWKNENYVTLPGFHLWIDEVNRSYETPSPFVGFQDDPRSQGIGLGDGLRYDTTRPGDNQWRFILVSAGSYDPALKVSPEFFVDETPALSGRSKSFPPWRMHNDPTGHEGFSWSRSPERQQRSVFLQEALPALSVAGPVVEMKWDVNRPDEVGLRLADTPANQQFTRWRLRIGDGTQQLWRIVRSGEKFLDSKTVALETAGNEGGLTVPFEPKSDGPKSSIRWHTDESLPLQKLERQPSTATLYRGLNLYDGLLLSFGIEIPDALHPSVSVVRAVEHPKTPGKAFPGGPVFTELLVDLNAKEHEWIWLRVEPKD